MVLGRVHYLDALIHFEAESKQHVRQFAIFPIRVSE